jgi:hypothetical protein
MTATGPTARTVARSARGPVLVVAALVLTAVAVAAYSATGPKAALDPRAYSPSGSHAVAALLQHRGVAVRRVETVTDLTASGGTVFVPVAAALTPAELGSLRGSAHRLVVVGADTPRLAALGLTIQASSEVPTEGREPACILPAAARAGEVDLGGVTYTGSGASTECYAAGGRATLVAAGRATLLGSADLFTNARLDKRGNADLALALLGNGGDVQWLLPRPGARGAHSGKRLNDLLPRSLTLGALQLLVAAGVLALWRARQLGAVVTEPLPVVVRAAEAVEGRGRLYRAARARGTAAEALRDGARDRLTQRLGLGPEAGAETLVGAVVAHTGRDPVALHRLLYGAAPTDDGALVTLADDLDILTLEVVGS